MSEIKAKLCNDCPARGLCLGEVSLEIIPLKYGDEKEGFPGFAIKGSDEDDVSTVIHRVVPEKYDINSRKGSKSVDTYTRDGALRSDKIFQALSDQQEYLLEKIVERAEKCEQPDRQPYTSGVAMTYEYSCRALACKVLERLSETGNS